MWQINILNDWETVWSESFQTTWRNIFHLDEEPNPFWHPDIVKAWVDSNPPGDPFFILAILPDKCSILLPLQFKNINWKSSWIHRLEPIGQNFFDYHSPLTILYANLTAKERLSFSEQLTSILARFGIEEIPQLLHLTRPTLPPLLGTTIGQEKILTIDLGQYSDFDSYLSSRRKKMRGDIRRQIRRLEELGSIKIQSHDSAKNKPPTGWLKDFQNNRATRFGSAFPESFLVNLLEDNQCAEVLAYSSLTLNDKVIASHIGFRVRDKLFWYLPIFEPAFSQFSPGKIHLAMEIELAIQQGYKTFDLMRGEEAYKLDWSNSHRTISIGRVEINSCLLNSKLTLERSIKHLSGLKKSLANRKL